MDHNHSPWLQQLDRKRPLTRLEKNIDTHVAIVGGGIAGLSTAYFALKDTDKNVTLVESGKLAHGATGHNAGQLVSYFERQLSDLMREFGLEKAAYAQSAIISAWDLLDAIYADAKLTTPLYKCAGYAGCMDMEEVLVHLENARHYHDARIDFEKLLVADEWEHADKIPATYEGLYSRIPHAEILSLLETTDRNYIAVIVGKKGCLNSARFTEELAGYLLATYPERFVVYEETHVNTIRLTKQKAMLETANNLGIRADRIVLCTNGYEKFAIENEAGPEINTRFHQTIKGTIGYMAAYLDAPGLPPAAISYLPHRARTGNEKFDIEPYFYLTRRPHTSHDGAIDENLICIGGPESEIEDTHAYTREHPYSDEAQRSIDAFLHKTYAHSPRGTINYTHRWHGLMGYTPNGIRRIGPEPHNPILLYNLGCNGIGILPSIYGGQRIAWILQGKPLEPSIFDPASSF